MLIYCNAITPRLRYVADFIGKEITGKPFLLNSDQQAFKQHEGLRINYSDSRITDDEIWIKPHTLLFEKGIRDQAINYFDSDGNKAFFKTEGDLPFDIFAACFYLLSRYEEYLPHQKDRYGRYAPENSLAFKEKFLHLPLINQWMEEFKKRLKGKHSTFNTQHSTFIPTYDIDEAYSYKYKRPLRTAGAIAKAMLKGNWQGIAERRKVMKGKIPDPFDSYDWMDDLHRQHHLHPKYFFLVPERTGKYDRNILPREKALQQLIKEHAGKYDIGIHPSWQSEDDLSLLKKEKQTLENLAGKKIIASRQHFIRFTLPQTYRWLIDAGMEEDYSMGYGSVNGFRASVASPFYWYDLEKEETTNLLLFPFCFMEANSFFEQKISPQQALKEINSYYKAVKEVNGTFICIWHNTFLGTGALYKGWREVYERFISGREQMNKELRMMK